MRIRNWLLLFRKKYEVVKQVDFLQAQIRSVLEENRLRQERFEATVQEVSDAIIDYNIERSELTESNARMQNSLNGAMQKLEILEEITIPYLYKLLSTYSTAWDCQTAQNAMRTAFVENKGQKGEQ